MNIERLQKKREKFRQKMIERFGNPILKMCATSTLKNVEEDVKDLEGWFIAGGGVRTWRTSLVRYGDKSRFANVISYYETLPFIEKVIVTELGEDEQRDYEVEFNFIVPTHENLIGERFYQINTFGD